jgi:hypothetical protein
MRRYREMLTILLLLLSVATGATAEERCVTYEGGYFASAYPDMVRILELPKARVGDVMTILRLLDQGRITKLPAGTPVEIRGQPLANGAVQIRLPGTSQDFWTSINFLNCPR